MIKPISKRLVVFIIFSITLLFLGITMSQIALPPSQALTLLLKDVHQLNLALKENPQLLSGTRLENLDLNDLVIQGAILENLHWRNIKLNNAQWSDVTVKDSQWLGVRFNASTLSSVVFDNTTMNVEPDTFYSNTTFRGGRLIDVVFHKSELFDVNIDTMKNSSITFDNTRAVSDPNLNTGRSHHGGIGELEARIRIINKSVIDDIDRMQYPSEVYIENSKLIGGISGELKRLEIKDSIYDGQGPDRSDYALVENSTVDIGFRNSRFVHLKNNRYYQSDNKTASSIGLVKVETAVIEQCRGPMRLGMARKAHVKNVYIRDCLITEPYLIGPHVGSIEFCDSTLEIEPQVPVSHTRNLWDGAQLGAVSFYNTRFTGNLPKVIKNLQIGTLGTDGRHPVPFQLRQAVQQQITLGACPPLPDIETLKQKALQAAEPEPLAGTLWQSITTKYGSGREDITMPFEYAYADSQTLTIPLRREWLARVQAYYSIAPGTVLPPVRAATLATVEDGPRGDYGRPSLILNPGREYQRITNVDPHTLTLRANRQQGCIAGTPYHLLLWFDTTQALPEYTHTPPWNILLAPRIADANLPRDRQWPEYNAYRGLAIWSNTLDTRYSHVVLPKEPAHQPAVNMA